MQTPAPLRPPVIVSCGVGVDSMAVLIGMRDRGERPDLIIHADTGAEKPETVAYIQTIQDWLARQGWPRMVVVRRYGDDGGQFGPHSRPNKAGRAYVTFQANLGQNETLPSLSYRRKSCSSKWKQEPIDRYLRRVEDGTAYDCFTGELNQNASLPSLALRSKQCSAKWKQEPIDRATRELLAEARAAGIKPIKVLGMDNGPADRKRTARVSGREDPLWSYRYPLQEWGWTRRDCVDAIVAEGLPVPLKSACYFCPASRWWEVLWLAQVHPELLRQALEIEDCAAGHLKHPYQDDGAGRCLQCGQAEDWKAHHTAKGPAAAQTVHGLGSCGTFSWRSRLEAEGVIEVDGYQVVAAAADLETRWRALAGEDNALDGRTVASPGPCNPGPAGLESLPEGAAAADPEETTTVQTPASPASRELQIPAAVAVSGAERPQERLDAPTPSETPSAAPEELLEPQDALEAVELGAPCPHCGAAAWEIVELAEVWDGREFMLGHCCEAAQEELRFAAELDPNVWTWMARAAGVEELAPASDRGLRRAVDANRTGQVVLDWNLEVGPIEWREARALVEEHHRHNRPPRGWRFGAGIWNGPDLIGVVIVGRPTARAYDRRRVVEVTRLCIREDVPRALAWNACSMLYGWAAREARRRGFERVITYTLEAEAGTSLKAAGFRVDGRTKGGTWNTPSRPRADVAPPGRKTRWARELRAAA